MTDNEQGGCEEPRPAGSRRIRAPLLALDGRIEPITAPPPLELQRLIPGRESWIVEVGFGKGRFLLAQAAANPQHGFVGIEVASRYFRLASRRATRRGLHNLVLLRGEAIFVLATYLPRSFAGAVHVYFPDPWPKSRHHKRRLFDPESIDLLLGLLRPGGTLFFATDHAEYGAEVESLLRGHPALDVEGPLAAWPDGPRTNYEAKFVREGRPILRLCVRLRDDPATLLHPAGRAGILVGPRGARGESQERSKCPV